MKRVLITGANSFIGTSFERYIKDNYANDISIETLDMQDACWMQTSFSAYDCIFHVAGIAHSDGGKISSEKEKLYYAVNTELTIAAAKKAKKDGVRQFIFMSSAIVYGESAPIGKKKVITRDTPVSPANCYGNSKVLAENGLRELEDDGFKVAILRPPMIYGRGSKGNYPVLAKMAKKLPVFPYVKNERSVLYVENLCEFVRLLIKNSEQGLFWPQNEERINTSELVDMIARVHGRRILLAKGFSGILAWMGKRIGLVNKAFGSLSYDEELSRYRCSYCVADLKESIIRTEGKCE